MVETSASADGGCLQSHRSGLSRSQIEGEVVSVALVHHFHAEVGAVQHISPGVQDTALSIQNRLVEVETVQVERHGADTHGCEPDADHRPGSQEEVKAAAVVEGGVLEDQATEVTVGSHAALVNSAGLRAVWIWSLDRTVNCARLQRSMPKAMAKNVLLEIL